MDAFVFIIFRYVSYIALVFTVALPGMIHADQMQIVLVLPVLYPGIILYAVSYDNIIPSFITFLKLSCIFYRIREERGERREYHFYFTYSKSLSK